MDILNFLLIFLLLIFPIAEIGKIQIGSISLTLNDFFVFLTVFIWIVKDYKNINYIRKAKLFNPIAIFTLVALLSLAFNIFKLDYASLSVSFLYLLRFVAYSSIYFILVGRDKKFIRKFSYFLLFPISVILLFGFVQFTFYQSLRNLFYLGWDEHLYRMFSSFFDPNFAGAFFVISLLILIYFVFQFYYKKQQIPFFLTSFLAAANFIAIYLTYSRSALIMLFVSLLTFLILIKKAKLLFVLSITLLIFVFISPKSFQTEGTNLLRVTSTEARLSSASEALKIISSSPIFGVGFNAYRYAAHRYGFVTGDKWETTHSGAGTDNSFLFVFATTGVIGFTAYLYLIYKILKLGFLKTKKSLISVVLVSTLVGVLVDSLFINSLFYVYILEWIFILAALTENS